MIPVDDVRVPDGNRFGQGDKPEECWICGRGLTARQAESGWQIHVGGAGSHIVGVDDPPEPEEHDLGWFPVGSDCARTIPRSHRERAA